MTDFSRKGDRCRKLKESIIVLIDHVVKESTNFHKSGDKGLYKIVADYLGMSEKTIVEWAPGAGKMRKHEREEMERLRRENEQLKSQKKPETHKEDPPEKIPPREEQDTDEGFE